MRFLDEFLEKKFGREKMEKWTPRILLGGFTVLAVLTPISYVIQKDLSIINTANERSKIDAIIPYIKENHPGVSLDDVTLMDGEETDLCPKYSQQNGFVLETQEPIRAVVNFPFDSLAEFVYKNSETREFAYDFCLVGRTNLTALEELYFDNLEILLCKYNAIPFENKGKE